MQIEEYIKLSQDNWDHKRDQELNAMLDDPQQMVKLLQYLRETVWSITQFMPSFETDRGREIYTRVSIATNALSQLQEHIQPDYFGVIETD